jgi:hypothetical protein
MLILCLTYHLGIEGVKMLQIFAATLNKILSMVGSVVGPNMKKTN